MPYYLYAQNNSGGKYSINDTYAYNHVIEAQNAFSADCIARYIGVYFDGVEQGIDCQCCGDRWTRATESVKPETVIINFWDDNEHLQKVVTRVKKYVYFNRDDAKITVRRAKGSVEHEPTVGTGCTREMLLKVDTIEEYFRALSLSNAYSNSPDEEVLYKIHYANKNVYNIHSQDWNKFFVH